LAFASILKYPFTLDETEEALMGQKVSKIGAKTFLNVPEGSMDVTHPLLYTYSHSLVQRIFGHGEIVLRLYNIFHYMLSLFLVILITRILAGDSQTVKNVASLISATLYISNPLLLQHSVVVNSDNSIVTTAILVFAYFFIRSEQQKKEGKEYIISRLFLGLLFAICLWAKESTPIAMAVGLFLYNAFSKNRNRFLIDLVCIFFFGLIVFWISWWLYCAITGVDLLGFVKFTIIGKSKEAFSGRHLSTIIKAGIRALVWPIYWASAPLMLLMGLILGSRFYKILKLEKPKPIDFILSAAFFIWLPFQFIKPNPDMMKYQYPSYPLFITAIACYFAQAVRVARGEGTRLIKNRLSAPLILISMFALGAYYYNLGDYILVLWYGISQYMNSHFLIYYYLPIIIAVAACFFLMKKIPNFTKAVLLSVFFVIPINSGLLMNQAKADYATFEIYRSYGEAGLRDTIEYLSKCIRPGSTTALRNDLSYYMTHKKGIKTKHNFDPKRILAVKNPKTIAIFLARAPMEYIVFDKVSSSNEISNYVLSAIGQYFTLEKQIGDFYIFKRRK